MRVIDLKIDTLFNSLELFKLIDEAALRCLTMLITTISIIFFANIGFCNLLIRLLKLVCHLVRGVGDFVIVILSTSTRRLALACVVV